MEIERGQPKRYAHPIGAAVAKGAGGREPGFEQGARHGEQRSEYQLPRRRRRQDARQPKRGEHEREAPRPPLMGRGRGVGGQEPKQRPRKLGERRAGCALAGETQESRVPRGEREAGRPEQKRDPWSLAEQRAAGMSIREDFALDVELIGERADRGSHPEEDHASSQRAHFSRVGRRRPKCHGGQALELPALETQAKDWLWLWPPSGPADGLARERVNPFSAGSTPLSVPRPRTINRLPSTGTASLRGRFRGRQTESRRRHRDRSGAS